MTADIRPLTVLDDTAVTARHIVRADESTPGAVEVLPGQWWAPAPGDALEGEQGWVSASVDRRLSDHGLLNSLVLPNAPGPDGVEHKARFAYRTDPRAKVGTDWVEFTDRASQRALAVVSPISGPVTGSTVTPSGVDAGALLAGWREEQVAPWTASAPHDVIDWYSQAPTALVHSPFAADLDGWTPAVSGGGATSVAHTAGGVRLLAQPPASVVGHATLTHPAATDGRVAGWSVTSAVRPVALGGGGKSGGTYLRMSGLSASGLAWGLYIWPGAGQLLLQLQFGALGSGPIYDARVPMPSTPDPQGVELSVHARDGWMIVTCNGQVAIQVRRAAGNDLHRVQFAASCDQAATGAARAEMVVRRCSIKAVRPFLRRAAPAIDYRLPGAPPSGGLTGDYYLETNTWAKQPMYGPFWNAALAPLAEPYATRIDSQIGFGGASWMPPGPPSGRQFAVRWHGAIYLPLDEHDVTLRLDGGGGTGPIVGMARAWVGTTRASSPYIDATWAGEQQAGVTGPSVQMHLGTSESGWYPIVIEYAVGGTTNPPHVLLSISTSSGMVIVPATQLSPYGCWSGDAAGESHREMIDTAAQSSGMQWRMQPRTLESGEFPGRLEFGRPVGLQSDFVLGEHAATEYMSDTNAAEVANRIHGDGAGLGKADGSDQGLTVEMLDPEATNDPWLTTRYEQLADITERTLMQQRLDALLVLHSTPHEVVAARPRVTADEQVYEWADAFPTVGEARTLFWEPGDGIRLDLPSVGVQDLTPRQIATVQQTLRPAGRVPPVFGFRQRPRHFRERLRALSRQSAVQRRRYQGQIALLSGSNGSTSTGIAPDGYSRLGLPAGGVRRVDLRVIGMSGTAGIEVLGVATGITATQAGTYDVTAWVPAGATEVYARMTSPTGIYNIQLVATVTV
jgi:hypothetical protein